MEGNLDWNKSTKDPTMAAVVNLAQKRVVPYARTRFNIIPSQSQEVSTPRSRLLGAYTIRGC
eukprot:2945268-Prorocentrum_lima.AAC.1